MRTVQSQRYLEKRWVLPPDYHPARDKLQEEFAAKLPPELAQVVAAVLINRGIHSLAESYPFFNAGFPDLHDPFQMKDMGRAADRLIQAIRSQQHVMLFGDYDVDGTTAVSMSYLFLRKHLSQLDCYIPDRYTEGYGLSATGIDQAVAQGCQLMIVLDCGIKSLDLVAYAQNQGLDIIVCDHHNPGEQVPPAVAVLDPKQADCPYPYKELSGCGVGFKLMQAVAQRLNYPNEELSEVLDLLAISIASDIVPIRGENRILTRLGMQKMEKNPLPGIAALMEVSGLVDRSSGVVQSPNVSKIVFGIGPRINAAGRIHHGSQAVEVLTETDPDQANLKAQKLQVHNQNRQDLDAEITQEALQAIEETPGMAEAATTVLHNPDWHKGVIGIVASRLIENYYRPTIVFTSSQGKLTGSARSVAGFSIYEALQACEQYLDQWGGHDFAAGMALSEANYEAFRQAFEKQVAATMPEELKVPEIKIDALLNLSTTFDQPRNLELLFRMLKKMAPFGPGNRRPVFLARELFCHPQSRNLPGKNGGPGHLKLFVYQRNSQHLVEAIGFQLGAFEEPLIRQRKPFDAVFSLSENQWQGRTTYQLELKDLKIRESAAT